MKADEVEKILLTEIDCLNRQKRQECKHDCIKCELSVSGDKLIEAVETSLNVVHFLEKKREESKLRVNKS